VIDAELTDEYRSKNKTNLLRIYVRAKANTEKTAKIM
jgi:hypothetical protein